MLIFKSVKAVPEASFHVTVPVVNVDLGERVHVVPEHGVYSLVAVALVPQPDFLVSILIV